jgi:hypothetical protein
MEHCISYEPYTFEYLVPSPIIFSTLCLSFDRTELFIMAIVRLFIWILMYFIISEYIDYDKYPTVKYIFLTILGMNILYIGMVVAKKPVFSLGAGDTVSYFNAKNGTLTGSIPHTLN